jgi:hypothetical protein
LKKCWVIPPRQNADFVAHMEDVLEVYKRPLDGKYPVVCMDEQPLQLIAETRRPIPVQEGRVKRYDYEYERCGTAALFLFVQPLAAWRRVSVREQRTKVDWAQEIERLLEEDFPDAAQVRLVCDNLNTHKLGSLYAAFEPRKARRLAERLRIHYTPKHGSWLNVAEIELSALSRQCLDRRIATLGQLRRHTGAWYQDRNRMQTGVDWQFTTEGARVKLKHLYPQYLS